MFGSITSKDLAGRSAAPAARAGAPAGAAVIPSGAAYVDVPVSGTRAIIAKRLLESKTTIPHYYLTVDINMDEVSDIFWGFGETHIQNRSLSWFQIVKLRAKFNKRLEKEGVKLSVNDFVIKATAIASKKVPEVNSAWMGSTIRM